MTRTRALLVLLLVSACDCGSDVVEVKPLLSVDPARLDFGVVRAGRAVKKQVRVENPGAVSLALDPSKITEDSRSAFTVGTVPATIAESGWATVDVTYTAPSTTGADKATLTFSGEGLSASVELTGTSTESCPGGDVESACGNAKDDDCDGFGDCDDPDCSADPACAPDVCATLGDPIRLSPLGGSVGGSTVAFVDDGFGVVWQDYSGPGKFMYSRLSASGVPGPDIVTATSRESSIAHPLRTLPWNGSALALAYSDIRTGANEIRMQLSTRDGTRAADEVKVSADGSRGFPASVAWNATLSQWAVFWGDRRDANGDLTLSELYFRAITRTGTPTGADVRVTTNGQGVDYSSVAWHDGAYGIAWADGRANNGATTKFARVSGTGALLGDVVTLSPSGDGSAPAVTETATGWAVVHGETAAHKLVLHTISSDGTVSAAMTLADVAVSSNVAQAAAQGAGDTIGVAWTELLNGRTELGFRTFSSVDGTPKSPRSFVHCVPTGGVLPSVARGGGKWAVAFTAIHTGSSAAYARLFSE